MRIAREQTQTALLSSTLDRLYFDRGLAASYVASRRLPDDPNVTGGQPDESEKSGHNIMPWTVAALHLEDGVCRKHTRVPVTRVLVRRLVLPSAVPVYLT